MRWFVVTLTAVAIGAAVVVTVVKSVDDNDGGPPPSSVSSGVASASPGTTTSTPLPVAFCPETAKSDQVRPSSALDGQTAPRTSSGPHRLAYFEVSDEGMEDMTTAAAQYLPTGTSQQGPVQVVVCEYAAPTNERIGTCDGYQRPGHEAISVVVTGVQYTYKAYDADSKRLLDGFALPGIRVCPSSVTTVDDVPRSIDARSDYAAVIRRLLPHLRM